METLIGVVIPVLNCLAYTRQAVGSIQASKVDARLEIYLIDNASTDETPAYATEHPEIHYQRQEKNLGVAASWNLGILWSRMRGHDAVFVANNDIVVAEDTLANLLRWRKEGVPFVTVHSIATQPSRLVQYARQHTLGPDLDCCGFLFDFSLIESVGWFDEEYWPAYWEDRDYEMRLRKEQIRHGRGMDALVVHFRSRTFREGGVKLEPFFSRNRERFVSKHGHVRGLT